MFERFGAPGDRPPPPAALRAGAAAAERGPHAPR